MNQRHSLFRARHRGEGPAPEQLVQSRMRFGSRVFVALSFALALVVTAACPKPLADAQGPRAKGEGPSQVAPDAVAVLRLPRLERAERALKLYLEGTRAQARSELEAMLALAVGGRAPGTALLGLDRQGALLVSWRPTGEVLVWLSVEDERLFSLALDRLLSAQGASRGDDLVGTVRVYRGADGNVSMLARPLPKGALLWPAPNDAFSAAALLDALATGRVPGRWPTGAEPPPDERAAAEVFASGLGVAALAPSLSAPFGGPQAVTGARGQLYVEDGAVRLDLSLGLDDAARERLRERTKGATDAPAGFCSIDDAALARLRFPVAMLREDAEDEAGPLDELQGTLALALLPRAEGAPGWIALSRPRGLSGKNALLASVTAAGVVEQRQERVGARTVRRYAAPSAPAGAEGEGALSLIADEDLFALAFSADEALRAVAEGAPCEEASGAAVHLVVKPKELAAALPSASSPRGASDALGAEGAISALGRLAARLPQGFQRLEGTASLDEGGVVLRARGRLSPRERRE